MEIVASSVSRICDDLVITKHNLAHRTWMTEFRGCTVYSD